MGERRPFIPALVGGLLLALAAGGLGEALSDPARLGLVICTLALAILGFVGRRVPLPAPEPALPAAPSPDAPVSGPPPSLPTAAPFPAPEPPRPEPPRPEAPPRAPSPAHTAPQAQALEGLGGEDTLDWAVQTRSDLFLGLERPASETPRAEGSSRGDGARLAEAERALARREEALRETQGEVHTLEGRIEELEAQLKEQNQAVFDARFRQKRAAEEAREREEQARQAAAERAREALNQAGGQWEEERRDLLQRQEALSARLAEAEAARARLQGEIGALSQGADEGRRTLLRDLETARGALAEAEAERDALSQAFEKARGEAEALDRALEEGEAKAAAEAARMAADRAALEAGRASLQREVEEKTREVSRLKARLRGGAPEGGGDPREPLLVALEGAGVGALFIGEEGLIAGVSAPLAERLGISEGEILGLDTWSFTTDVLSTLTEDGDALEAQQAALLEGVDAPRFEPIPLKEGGYLLRWVYPLPKGAGQMEIFAESPAQLGPAITPELEGALERLRQAAGHEAQPSSLTTLEALGRQLQEMSKLLPEGDGALEARARLSTAKALVTSLLNAPPADGQGEGAAAELARRVLGPLERAMGHGSK